MVNFDNTLGSSALNQQQIDSISGLYFLSSESGNLIYPSVVLSLTKNELLTKNQNGSKKILAYVLNILGMIYLVQILIQQH